MKKLVSLVVLAVLLAACSNEAVETHEIQHNDSHEIAGDQRQQTPSKEVLPEFLTSKSQEMQGIYLLAAGHQDLLEHIPCYCGCGDSVGHKNNYDCFVYQNNEDESLVWDDHGTKCMVCLEIAVQAIGDYNEGKSIKEIRTSIDQAYQNGYAVPTPTPAL